jgi:hypothetical protein
VKGRQASAICLFKALEGARTTATLVRTEMASHARVTGGICVNQASKPTGIDTVGAAAAESLRLIDDATGPAPRGPTNVSQEQRSGNTPGRTLPIHYFPSFPFPWLPSSRNSLLPGQHVGQDHPPELEYPDQGANAGLICQ